MAVIISTSLHCQPQPLKSHFGFKGGALTELWQVFVRITLDDGRSASGQSVQSVLWSDAAVFSRWGQEAGNEKMLALTAYALQCLEGMSLESPAAMLEALVPRVLEKGIALTETPGLRTTFVLNALTGIDFCLWKLFRQEMGCPALPELVRPVTAGLQEQQKQLGLIPLISYDTAPEQIHALAQAGCFLFKIKIGSAPNGSQDPEEMLRWDVQRLEQVHSILSQYDTPWTNCAKPLYYMDANGRYGSRQLLERFLEKAEDMGALERIALLEEPFSEGNPQDVRGLPVLVAADESIHSAADAVRLIEEYGYGAMALKPIAKTLSVSLAVLEEARKRDIPCFCADLTVNPTMVEVNKRFAAGLKVLPGLKCGVFESNGPQNYVNWDALCTQSPAWNTPWATPENGLFTLPEQYYLTDGNIWKEI